MKLILNWSFLFYIIVLIVLPSCANQKSSVILNSNLTELELFEIGLKRHYPKIPIRGAVYLNDTAHSLYNIEGDNDRGEYCRITLKKIKGNDSVFLNGCGILWGEILPERYSLNYNDPFTLYEDSKADTIFTFDSLSIYKLKVVISDDSKKVKYYLSKLYQSQGNWK